MSKRSSNVSWLERQLGTELTDVQARLLETACSLARVYNLDRQLAGRSPADRWRFGKTWLEISFKGELATFDYRHLTDLVLAAHADAVRVAVVPKSSMSLEIRFTPRDPESKNLFSRHPTSKALKDLIDNHKRLRSSA